MRDNSTPNEHIPRAGDNPQRSPHVSGRNVRAVVAETVAVVNQNAIGQRNMAAILKLHGTTLDAQRERIRDLERVIFGSVFVRVWWVLTGRVLKNL
jgi:hypothetical protein